MTTLADYQWLYQGVTCGHGTPYKINTWDGLRALPELRTSDWARLRHHGAFSGIDVLEGRIITMTLTVTGTSASNLETLLAPLETATVPLFSGSLPMSYKLPNQVQRQVETRTRKRATILEPTYNLGWQKISLEWFCGDPRLYSDALTTTVIASSGSITNTGNFESRPVVTVTPSSDPVTITNTSDAGNVIVLASSMIGSIPSPCVVDLLNRTVVDGSGANRFDVVDPSTTWTVLLPGVNNITVSGGSTSWAWRSAWI